MLPGVPPGHIGAMKAVKTRDRKMGGRHEALGQRRKREKRKVDETNTEVQRQGRNIKN